MGSFNFITNNQMTERIREHLGTQEIWTTWVEEMTDQTADNLKSTLWLSKIGEKLKWKRWAIVAVAFLFGMWWVAKWWESIPYSAEELRAISEELDEKWITEENWQRMREVASYFDEVDEDAIRNCAEKEDMMAKRDCEDERTVEASELEYEVLVAEEERSLERQADQEETLADQEETLADLDEWKQALEILNDVVEWDKQGNEQEVLEAAEYVVENSERFEQQIIDFANTILEQN